MSEETSAVVDVSSAVSGLEASAGRMIDAAKTRFAAFDLAPGELDQLRTEFEAQGVAGWMLGVQILAVCLLASLAFLLVGRLFRSARSARRSRALAPLAAAAAALVAGFAAASLIGGAELAQHTLRLWVIVTTAGHLAVGGIRFILIASRPEEEGKRSRRLAELAHDLSIATIWAMIGLAAVSTLRLWGAGPALTDVARTGLVAIPVFVLFIRAVRRNRHTLSSVIGGRRPRSRWHASLARHWPAIVIWFLILTFLSTETAFTLAIPLPGWAVLLTVIIVFLTPHLDAIIGHHAKRQMAALDASIVTAAAQQTARFVIFVVMIAMLGAIWVMPLAAELGVDMQRTVYGAIEIAVIAMASAFLWNVIGSVTRRAMHHDPLVAAEGDDEPRSRLGTLVPLLSGVGKSTIAALALLSILVSFDVNVWPLITGLSVFGLAIGFGSQTLVKDVVSGLFFLIDDAFRFGEYIETSGAKGTVEKISVRSVSLRHQRGALATIPYGQIGKIQNFSRDWVIEKMTFRVAFDTDVESIRKIFKQIGADIAEDPELAGDLIEPFKSQGIADVEDGTLIIRATFKAKAGKQSMIRRAALIAVHRAFRENGIQAVARPLTGLSDGASGS